MAHRDAGESAHNHALAAWLHDHLPAVQVYGHAAGLLGFDLLPDLTADKFGAVIKPKASWQRGAILTPAAHHRALDPGLLLVDRLSSH